MIGCLTETTTCVVAKPLVSKIRDVLFNLSYSIPIFKEGNIFVLCACMFSKFLAVSQHYISHSFIHHGAISCLLLVLPSSKDIAKFSIQFC